MSAYLFGGQAWLNTVLSILIYNIGVPIAE